MDIFATNFPRLFPGSVATDFNGFSADLLLWIAKNILFVAYALLPRH